MKFILEYKSYQPKFTEGDVVLIRYWYLKEEECPNELRKKMPHTKVVIKKDLGRGRFRVGFDVEGSPLFGAPEQDIRKSDIIDHFRS